MSMLPPPADGFDRAWTAGRRRRRRALAGAGGIGSGIVTTGLLLALFGSVGPFQLVDRTDTLADGADASATPSGSPSPKPSGSTSPGPTSTTPSPGAGGVVDGLVGLIPGFGPSPSASGDPSTTATPDPSSGPSTSADPGNPGGDASSSPLARHSYRVVRDDVPMPSGGCAPAGQPTAPWCLQFPGPFSTASGQTKTYTVRLCRVSNSGDGSLQFRSAVEADFSLYDASNSSRKEWSSSTGLATSDGEHAVSVAAGHCARWRVDWDTFDDNGEILPRSTGYSFQAAVSASTQDPMMSSDSSAFSIT